MADTTYIFPVRCPQLGFLWSLCPMMNQGVLEVGSFVAASTSPGKLTFVR